MNKYNANNLIEQLRRHIVDTTPDNTSITQLTIRLYDIPESDAAIGFDVSIDISGVRKFPKTD